MVFVVVTVVSLRFYCVEMYSVSPLERAVCRNQRCPSNTVILGSPGKYRENLRVEKCCYFY